MVGQNHSQAVPNFLLWELSQGNLGVLQQRNPGNAAGIGHSKAQRASRTTQPRHWAVPRKHIAEGPQGAAGRGRARQRSSLLEGAAPSAPTFPARQRGLVIEIDWPIEREKVGRHGGRPSSFITNAARQRLSKTWRAMLRRRPLFPRASVALSDGWGRGCAQRESDDTEVVPPVLLRARRVSAYRNPLEGDAPSAPTSPARQRGFVGGMGAGLRPAEVGRHGGRPSSFVTSAAREQNDDSRLPRRNGLG